MDPTSITAAIKGLYKASETIYNFIQDSRIIDASISNLQRQVDGLARVLDTLSNELERQLSKNETPEKRQLWGSVAHALEACYPTVRELDEKLHGVWGDDLGKINLLSQASKTFRLGLNKEDIDRMLSTMQTHSINLQLALGIVQLMIAASAPETLAHELSSRFERLERMMMTVDERLATQSYPQHLPRTAENKVSGVKLDDNTRSLRRSAATMVLSASTATGRSVSGMTRRATIDYGMPAFDHFDPPEAEQVPAIEESTTGSELGKPIDSSRRTQIQSWIQASSANLTNVSETPEDGAASTATPSEALASIFSGMSVVSDTEAGASILEIFNESSDEDGLDLQVIKNYLARAESKMQDQEFTAAEVLLRRCLDESQYLSEKKKKDLNLSDVQLQYARCCFLCGRIKDAEELYLVLTREPVKDVQGATRVLHALHGLADLNLKKRNFEAATTHCRQALAGRRRTKTIGKHHIDYFASLRLLALINWAKNDKVQAEAYADMLPKEQTLDAQSFGGILETEYGISASDILSLNTSSEILSPSSQQSFELWNTPSRTSFTGGDRPPIFNSSPQQVRQDLGISGLPQQSQQPRLTPPSSPPEYATSNTPKLPRAPPIRTAQTQPQSRLPESPITVDSPPQSPSPGKKDPSVALLAAVKSNNLDLARILCQGFGQKTKADVNVRGPFGQTPLIMAATMKNEALCTLLLRRHALVDLQDLYGNTALKAAVTSGSLDVCQILISFKADLNLVDGQGRTPLMWAAFGSNLSLCELLISSGAKVDVRDIEEKEVLDLATDPEIRMLISRCMPNPHKNSTGKQSENSGEPTDIPKKRSGVAMLDQFDPLWRNVMNELLSMGITEDRIDENAGFIKSYIEDRRKASTDLPPVSDEELNEAKIILLANDLTWTTDRDTAQAMIWSIENSYYPAVVMITRLSHVDLQKQYMSDLGVAESVLHVSARNGAYNIFHVLLNSGASVNALNSKFETPLDEAARYGRLEIVKLLIDRGAWKDGAGVGGIPLTIAASKKHLDVCKLLLREGADPNRANEKGETALWIAADLADFDLYRLVVEAGADKDAVGHEGYTCLTMAAQRRNLSLCKHILAEGCDFNKVDTHGMAPLHYAAMNNDGPLCDQLLSRGAELNTPNLTGDTPLATAVKNMSSNIAQMLLRCGAHPNMADSAGKTPLIMAACIGSREMIIMLLGKGAEVSLRDHWETTALMYAAMDDNLEICQELVAWGAAVTLQVIGYASARKVKKFLKSQR